MEKSGKKRRKAARKRYLALLMSLCLTGTMLPVTARAESAASGGLCEHHTEHTAECGYVEAVEGHECEHMHDEKCGYQEAGECTHAHTEECGEEGESCTHVHDDGCGYAEAHECEHTHDESCGYVEAVEGSPCTFVCDTCGREAEPEVSHLSEAVLAVQERINALPDAADITEENFDETAALLDEIDEAKAKLTDEEIDALDYQKYEAAAAKLLELMGEEGAGEPEALELRDITVTMTGQPTGSMVRTINLKPEVLRPTSAWSSGGNKVYFGGYNGSPTAYRVLSSPSTQSGVDNCILLDCDTILVNKPFDADGATNNGQARLNAWSNSDLESWLKGNAFYGGSVFSTPEKEAIAETTLLEQNVQYFVDSCNRPYNDYSANNYVFLLSAAEAEELYQDATARKKTGGQEDWWWLRSRAIDAADMAAGTVDPNGRCDLRRYNQTAVGVSPALNVKRSSVLFASESGMNKAASTLTQVADSTAKTWKLTLLDSSKRVSVSNGQNITRADNGGAVAITVPYTYTDSSITNAVSQISVMLTDKVYNASDAKVLYYGALQNATITAGGTTGTGTFTLPSALEDKTCGTDYYAYIIAEDVNGEHQTDYASTPQSITIPTSVSTFTVTITDGTLSTGNTTGEYAQGDTVTITADTAQTGQRFKKWSVERGTVTLADSTSTTTTFSMPAEAVSVKAEYEPIPVPAPVITTQPDNVTVKEGETATFTIAASGDNPTYQWKLDRNDGNGWTDIAGANAASYTTSTVDKSSNGFQYKCAVSNSGGAVESDSAILTVQETGSSNPGGGETDNQSSGESEEQDTPSTPKMNYQIINGVNSSWTLGSSEGLTIRGNGEFSKLVGVKQDGSLLDRINYTAREGSTIITLNASYLNTLAAGTHTVEILWTDGSADTVFTIHADTSGNRDNTQNTKVILPDNSTLPDSTDRKDDVPKTGDSTPAVWLFVLASLSGAGLMVTGRKGKRPRKR